MQFLLSPSGRIGRLQWWLGGLVPFAILVAGFIMVGELIGDSVETTPPGKVLSAVVIFFGFFLISFWINFCLCAKRFHDRDKSAWWFLVNFVPVVGPIFILVECGFLPGTPGGNSYGAEAGAGAGWSSNVDAEIAAMWQAKHDSYQSQQPEVAVEHTKPEPRPEPRRAPGRAPAGFGRRGLQT